LLTNYLANAVVRLQIDKLILRHNLN